MIRIPKLNELPVDATISFCDLESAKKWRNLFGVGSLVMVAASLYSANRYGFGNFDVATSFLSVGAGAGALTNACASAKYERFLGSVGIQDFEQPPGETFGVELKSIVI